MYTWDNGLPAWTRGSRVSTTLQISSIHLFKKEFSPPLKTRPHAFHKNVPDHRFWFKIQQLALSRSLDTTNAVLAGITMLSSQEITLPFESDNAPICKESCRRLLLSPQMVAFHMRDPLRIRLELQPLRLTVSVLQIF